ncbi:protein TolR [Ectothiorhodospiraceae bacterium BW-2]|nr:protein TolR [Ectothiorhodospiraceae bacterium BW-2]
MRQRKRRLMAEINVVPYIDVMLVLLVIFMVTAPLITQGVKVALPQTSADPVSTEGPEPLVVTVDSHGELYLDNSRQPQGLDNLLLQLQTARAADPLRPVYLRGDEAVPYGRVVEVMALLQQAGIVQVGLLTRTLDNR